MGRSSGGGSHSSGGFSGGHSSGGFSGGGRSSSSHSSSSRSSYSSSSRSYRSSPRRSYGYGPRYGGYYSSGPVYRRRRSSVASTIFTILVIFIIIALLFGNIRSSSSGSSSVPSNTTQRTPLSGAVSKTSWYDDQIGWIRNERDLVSGLEDFYKETGVQPYVLLVPYEAKYWNESDDESSLNILQANNYLENYYKQKFKDEAHFIFAYFSCRNDSRSKMDGEFRYLTGYSAETIMDNEAIKIFWGYFENNYYNTSLSMEEMISKTFSQTGNRIMSKPTNAWDFAKIAVPVVGGLVAIFVVFSIVKVRAQRQKEREEFTKEILDKPLETFGNDTSDLEEKYK